MKKISVLLLAVMMLFAFTACDDNPNDEGSKIPMDTLKTLFKEVVGNSAFDISNPYYEDETFKSSEGYDVTYDMSTVKNGDSITEWVFDITATKEGADTISFTISSKDLGSNIEVTIGENKYSVAASDIKDKTIITGFVGDDDEEEKTPLAN